MPINSSMSIPDSGIQMINSLGGPPIPTGVSTAALKIILENIAASEAPLSGSRVAAALAMRRA